ncbi:MAG: hypothetical protein AAF244_00515 [Pseudomonadota bacterium]
MVKKDRRTIFKASVDGLSDADFEKLEALVEESDLSKAFARAKKSDSSAIPKWTDRKILYPGRKFNPVQWIKEHYGCRDGENNWSPNGLSMTDIHSDRPLYNAYRQWISRHKEDNLNLPTQSRKKVIDPQEGYDRRLAQSRASYHRNKS